MTWSHRLNRSERYRPIRILLLLAWALYPFHDVHGLMERNELTQYVMAPYQLGDRIDDRGIYTLRMSDGTSVGYLFETRHLVQVSGFSGKPINLLVMLFDDLSLGGVWVLEQFEPVFVSGLGVEPFQRFLTQYQGKSVNVPITVGVAYGQAEQSSANVVLDGVTKATASVRIANNTVLAAARKVARELMGVHGESPVAYPDPDVRDVLGWTDLVDRGIAHHFPITFETVQKSFEGTVWADDVEMVGEPMALDLWVLDVSPGSIGHAVLDSSTLRVLAQGNDVREYEEAVLLLANGPYRLLAENFVPNTAPDRILFRQNGLPVSVFDAYVDVQLKPGVPRFEQILLLRVDRRLGFNPAASWDLGIRIIRQHGSFMPEIGGSDLFTSVVPDQRYYIISDERKPSSVWLNAVYERFPDLAVLMAVLLVLFVVMLRGTQWIASRTWFATGRMVFLFFVLVFIGWYGQGQLSIVTPIGLIRAAKEQGTYEFLLYDPFSLLIWVFTLVSMAVWGRAFFCGWLCPYGALQELGHCLGRMLGLRFRRVPATVDRSLKLVKYGVLALLVVSAFLFDSITDTLVELEPFKTAITLGFVRDLAYVVYAVFWVVLGLAVFRPFCRYLCPLGAFLAICDLIRIRRWIPRRRECGAPCQLCRHRCSYNAINTSGVIDYRECFQCLDCVTIYENEELCVPLVLERKRGVRVAAPVMP